MSTSFATSSYRPTGQPSPAEPVGAMAVGWFTALSDDDPDAHRYLLALRFGVVNLIAFAVLGAAWLKGWIAPLLVSDGTRLVGLIAAVFLVGLAMAARKALQISTELNQIKAQERRPSSRVSAYLERVAGRDGQSRALTASALKLKLSGRIAGVRHIASSLVFLGLIGTVIGFIIALSGVDPAAAADVSAIGPMVSTLIDGMSIALNTTLVGAVLNIWLMVNYRLLEGGTVRLLTAIVELGERHAQS